jgi:hypothetical protein
MAESSVNVCQLENASFLRDSDADITAGNILQLRRPMLRLMGPAKQLHAKHKRPWIYVASPTEVCSRKIDRR